MQNRKIAVLDRDGTIISDKNYLSDPDAIEFLPNSCAGLRALQEFGWELLVVSNQSGIGRGFFSFTDYEKVTARLLAMLAMEKITIRGVYFCPHAPAENCECRKPKSGMLVQAARELNFSLLHDSFAVIGDKVSDVELGKKINACTILIGSQKPTEKCSPDFIAEDLLAAAQKLLNH